MGCSAQKKKEKKWRKIKYKIKRKEKSYAHLVFTSLVFGVSIGFLTALWLDHQRSFWIEGLIFLLKGG